MIENRLMLFVLENIFFIRLVLVVSQLEQNMKMKYCILEFFVNVGFGLFVDGFVKIVNYCMFFNKVC